MSDALKLGFVAFGAAGKGVVVVFCDDQLKFGAATRKAIAPAAELIRRAAKAERFTGEDVERDAVDGFDHAIVAEIEVHLQVANGDESFRRVWR